MIDKQEGLNGIIRTTLMQDKDMTSIFCMGGTIFRRAQD